MHLQKDIFTMHSVAHQSSQLIACMKYSSMLLNKLLIVNKGFQYYLDLCSSVELMDRVCTKNQRPMVHICACIQGVQRNEEALYTVNSYRLLSEKQRSLIILAVFTFGTRRLC